MTLIAAFRYQGGAVVFADSQETAQLPSGDKYNPRQYRVRVKKIAVEEIKNYQVVLGGAGPSVLIKKFTQRLLPQINGWPASLSVAEIEGRVSSSLLAFHSEAYVARYPAKDPLDFVLCVKPKSEQRVHLWEIRDTVMLLKDGGTEPEDNYSLVGWEEELYQHEVVWLYRPNSWLQHALQVGTRLFVLAEGTSGSIGSPFRVIIADKENGIYPLPPESVEELVRRVPAFNVALRDIITNASDMSINEGGLIETFGTFEEQIMRLRGYFTGRAPMLVRGSVNRELASLANSLGMFIGELRADPAYFLK